jgi:hypothetical protein
MCFTLQKRASDLMVTLHRIFYPAFSVDELQMTFKSAI